MVHLLILVLALAAVWIFFNEWRKRLPQPPDEYPVLQDDSRIGFADSAYFNYPFHVSLPHPGEEWLIREMNRDTLLTHFNDSLAIQNQILWMLVLQHERYANAQLKLGVLDRPSNHDPKEIAISWFNEQLANFESTQRRTQLLQPFTGPAHRLMQGYYWAFVAPESDSLIIVSALLPRTKVCYVTRAQCRKKEYEILRTDIQKLTSSIDPLLWELPK